ncbi:hypothetical protein DFH09DRAFT_1395870 [Mycena vulgaris]|nr:hypothetical protein DFH09DRAFT_1395870 [Mycena vulgaris]
MSIRETELTRRRAPLRARSPTSPGRGRAAARARDIRRRRYHRRRRTTRRHPAPRLQQAQASPKTDAPPARPSPGTRSSNPRTTSAAGHADPTHPCSKCWDKYARPYAGALIHAPAPPSSSSAPAPGSAAGHASLSFQRPLPRIYAPPPAPPGAYPSSLAPGAYGLPALRPPSTQTPFPRTDTPRTLVDRRAGKEERPPQAPYGVCSHRRRPADSLPPLATHVISAQMKTKGRVRRRRGGLSAPDEARYFPFRPFASRAWRRTMSSARFVSAFRLLLERALPLSTPSILPTRSQSARFPSRNIHIPSRGVHICSSSSAPSSPPPQALPGLGCTRRRPGFVLLACWMTQSFRIPDKNIVSSLGSRRPPLRLCTLRGWWVGEAVGRARRRRAACELTASGKETRAAGFVSLGVPDERQGSARTCAHLRSSPVCLVDVPSWAGGPRIISIVVVVAVEGWGWGAQLLDCTLSSGACLRRRRRLPVAGGRRGHSAADGAGSTMRRISFSSAPGRAADTVIEISSAPRAALRARRVTAVDTGGGREKDADDDGWRAVGGEDVLASSPARRTAISAPKTSHTSSPLLLPPSVHSPSTGCPSGERQSHNEYDYAGRRWKMARNVWDTSGVLHLLARVRVWYPLVSVSASAFGSSSSTLAQSSVLASASFSSPAHHRIQRYLLDAPALREDTPASIQGCEGERRRDEDEEGGRSVDRECSEVLSNACLLSFMLLSPTAIYIPSRCVFRPSSVPSSLYSRQLLRSSSLPPPPSPPSASSPRRARHRRASLCVYPFLHPSFLATFIRMAVGGGPGGERRTVHCRPSRAYIVRQQSPPLRRFQLQWALGGNSDASPTHDEDACHAPVSPNARARGVAEDRSLVLCPRGSWD